MPSYFMHLRRNDGMHADDQIYERRSLEEMRAEAIWGARDVMADMIKRGERPDEAAAFEITDEAGNVVLTVTFGEALDSVDHPRPSYG